MVLCYCEIGTTEKDTFYRSYRMKVWHHESVKGVQCAIIHTGF